MIQRSNRAHSLTLTGRSLTTVRSRSGKSTTPLVGLPMTLNVSGISVSGLGKDAIDLGEVNLKRRRLDDLEASEARARRSNALAHVGRSSVSAQSRVQRISERLVRVARCVTVVFW